MFIPEKMKLLKIITAKEKFSPLLQSITKLNCLHIANSIYFEQASEILRAPEEKKEIFNKMSALDTIVVNTCKKIDLGIYKTNQEIEISPFTISDKLDSEIRDFQYKVEDLIHSIADLEREIPTTELLSWQLNQLDSLGINVGLLSEPMYLYLKVGTIPAQQLPILENSIQNIPFVIESSYQLGKEFIICATLNQYEKSLQQSLSALDFQEVKLPSKGTTKEMFEEIELRLWEQKERLNQYKIALEQLKNEYVKKIDIWHKTLLMNKEILGLLKNFLMTEHGYFITAWVPQSKLKQVQKKINNEFAGQVIIDVMDSNEMENKQVIVPTKLKNPKTIKPFEKLLNIYGIPHYKAIDPTVFLAITFVFMFGMMFGDVGHGLVLFLAGLALINLRFFYKLKDFGYIFVFCGISAIVFGFLFGSFFGNEELIKPLWLHPLDNPNPLLISAIIFGVIVINLGIILNIITSLRNKSLSEAIFGQWSILSSMFFWVVLTIGYLTFTRKDFQINWYIVLPALFLPLFFIAFGRIIFSHKEESEEDLAEVIFKPFEIMLGLLTNTISFIRIAAFALTHAALMGSVFLVAEIMTSNAFTKQFMIINGNILVILLEGLIVFIQCLRLEYYEFFSKFFFKQGEKYKPLSFENY